MPKKAAEPVPFTFRHTLRWSRPTSTSTGGIITSFPKALAEREARQRGITIEKLVREFELEYRFGVGDEITIALVRKGKNGR